MNRLMYLGVLAKSSKSKKCDFANGPNPWVYKPSRHFRNSSFFQGFFGFLVAWVVYYTYVLKASGEIIKNLKMLLKKDASGT